MDSAAYSCECLDNGHDTGNGVCMCGGTIKSRSAAPVLLDLYCCEGGAAAGYHRAGWRVIGVDINPQPLYPFEFVQNPVTGRRPGHGGKGLA